MNGLNPISNIDPNGDYFFGLFGSTSRQREVAKYVASVTGGKVKNFHKKSIHVEYAESVGLDLPDSEEVVIVGINHKVYFKKSGESVNADGVSTEINWKSAYDLDYAIANGYKQKIGDRIYSTGKIEYSDIDPTSLGSAGISIGRTIFKSIARSSIKAAGSGSVAAAKTVTRSLDDLSSLRGATWKEAESLIPKGWTRGPLNKGEGIKFVNPAKKGEQILLEKGWPGAKDPLHAGPYMKISRNGTVERVPLQGNPTLK